MSEEEILAYNIEVITKQGINKENLDICMIYGISGNCGKRCPKFKDRTCEEYLTTLENEYKSDELEIERLNNIINELEEWLEKQKTRNSEWNNFVMIDGRLGIPISYLLNKLQELKGSDKE